MFRPPTPHGRSAGAHPFCTREAREVIGIGSHCAHVSAATPRRWSPRRAVGLVLAAVTLLLAPVTLSACGAGGRFIVIGTAKAPSTSGVVEVDALDGGSVLVSVHLEHLPPPQRLVERFETYVVWFVAPGGETVRAGELAYNPDSRTGDLSETSPLSTFTLKITAEKDKDATVPGTFVVASQRVQVQ